MPKILVSACLLGLNVRFDGNNNLQTNTRLHNLVKNQQIITICPEVAGGLTVPRDPAEIERHKTAAEILQQQAKILTINNHDVSAAYIAGANKTLALIQQHNIQVAILKARSPACGTKQVYDGAYTKTLTKSMGITAALLTQHGIKIFDETEIDLAIDTAIKLTTH